MAKDHRSRASQFRDKKKREKNKFKFVCTCTCLIHKHHLKGAYEGSSSSKLIEGHCQSAALEENKSNSNNCNPSNDNVKKVLPTDADLSYNCEFANAEVNASNSFHDEEFDEGSKYESPPRDSVDNIQKDSSTDSDSIFHCEYDAEFLGEGRRSNSSASLQDEEVDDGRHSESGSEDSHAADFYDDNDDDDDDEDDDDDDDDFGPPDNPDDPDFYDEEENQINDGEEDDTPNFGLNNPRLNIQCHMVQGITVREVLLMVITLGVRHSLSYITQRNPDNIEDILDGQRYFQLSQPGNVLSNRNNFSYAINNDGFRITRTSNAEAQPLYIRLNELSPTVRQKHILLAGIWIDEEAPNMNYLLDKCLIQQANDLSSAGLRWRRNEDYVQSLFIPAFCTADAKAKALLLNLNEPTGRNSCLFCDIEGVQARGIKFPLWPHDEMAEPLPRTHESIIADITEAVDQRMMVNGFRGATEFVNLDYFNLKEGFSTDDLHPIFVGVVKDYFERLFSSEGNNYVGLNNIALINRRWLTIKFPSCIARKPRKILSYKRWRGTEFRNFLLYGLTCLDGAVDENIVDNLRRLANAVYLLSQQSISEDNLIQAEEDLMVFLFEFEDMFHVEAMKFNVHVLTHLVEVVRSLGNLYAHSTCNFESWNHRLKKYVTSSWGACDQVVFRLLLNMFVSAARFDNRISERVKVTVESILMRTRLDNALRVGSVYLLGKVERRQISPEEQLLLQEEGILIDNPYIMVYKRAYYNNMEYRSVQYTREGRKDSSNIQIEDGAFAQIQKILVVSVGEQSVTGMVCSMYDNLRPTPILSYMFEVLPNNNQNLIWVPFNRFNSLAVKYSIPLAAYIAPIPNNVEID
ncbi:Halomucin [Frankliniella fusca]|uniref:Halomucin n=1 Tax=Frankliniella fusca TaxID=407009 RepID=A0AAE1HWM4_9NEOP|nr:Halomucin [Frankliniella fusca]